MRNSTPRGVVIWPIRTQHCYYWAFDIPPCRYTFSWRLVTLQLYDRLDTDDDWFFFMFPILNLARINLVAPQKERAILLLYCEVCTKVSYVFNIVVCRWPARANIFISLLLKRTDNLAPAILIDVTFAPWELPVHFYEHNDKHENKQ